MTEAELSRAADAIRGRLQSGLPAEYVYEPGTGTRYALVFLPLSSSLRVFPLAEQAFRGLDYDGRGALVYCSVGGRAYPFRLLGRHEADMLAPSYVAEKLGFSHPAGRDAIDVAALLCAVAHVEPLIRLGEWDRRDPVRLLDEDGEAA